MNIAITSSFLIFESKHIPSRNAGFCIGIGVIYGFSIDSKNNNITLVRWDYLVIVIDMKKNDMDTDIERYNTTTGLEAKDKRLKENISVKPIQIEPVSNLDGGRTVYIGGII